MDILICDTLNGHKARFVTDNDCPSGMRDYFLGHAMLDSSDFAFDREEGSVFVVYRVKAGQSVYTWVSFYCSMPSNMSARRGGYFGVAAILNGTSAEGRLSTVLSRMATSMFDVLRNADAHRWTVDVSAVRSAWEPERLLDEAYGCEFEFRATGGISFDGNGQRIYCLCRHSGIGSADDILTRLLDNRRYAIFGRAVLSSDQRLFGTLRKLPKVSGQVLDFVTNGASEIEDALSEVVASPMRQGTALEPIRPDAMMQINRQYEELTRYIATVDRKIEQIGRQYERLMAANEWRGGTDNDYAFDRLDVGQDKGSKARGLGPRSWFAGWVARLVHYGPVAAFGVLLAAVFVIVWPLLDNPGNLGTRRNTPGATPDALTGGPFPEPNYRSPFRDVIVEQLSSEGMKGSVAGANGVGDAALPGDPQGAAIACDDPDTQLFVSSKLSVMMHDIDVFFEDGNLKNLYMRMGFELIDVYEFGRQCYGINAPVVQPPARPGRAH